MEYTNRAFFVTTIVALLLPLAMMAEAQAAGVYKWTDESGQVHYGEKPPASDAEVKRVPIDKAPPSSANAQERLMEYQRELDSSMEERAKSEEEQAVAQKNKAIQQKNCETARSRLSKYDTAGRIYSKGGNGERQYLDEKQRAEERKQAQALVDKWCR